MFWGIFFIVSICYYMLAHARCHMSSARLACCGACMAKETLLCKCFSFNLSDSLFFFLHEGTARREHATLRVCGLR